MPIRQDRRNKTWFFRFTRDGRSCFKGGYRTASLAKQAEAIAFDQSASEQLHPERKGQELLFREAVQWYLETLPPGKKTAYIDRARLGLAASFFENKKVSDIRPEDIERFMARLPALRTAATPRLKTLSDQTRNHYLASLRALFNRLKKREKYLGSNPALGVSFMKVPRARVRFLYPAEEKLLSPIVMNDDVMWPYYFMALHTGMRIRELMGIQVKDVDLVMSQIFIPNSKTSKSRYAPMSPNVEAFVEAQMKGKNQEARLLPNWSYTHLRKRFRGSCGASGITDLRIHDLRHTFAQRLLSKGESIYLVSKLMGHSSVSVTQTHYGHLSTSDLSRTVGRIDGVVSCSQVAAGDLQQTLRNVVNGL